MSASLQFRTWQTSFALVLPRACTLRSNRASDLAGLARCVLGLKAGMHVSIFGPVRWIASISYPRYLLHVPLAWGAIYVFTSLGFGIDWSVVLASIMVVGVGWVTHNIVELSSQSLGTKLSKMFSKVAKTRPIVPV